MELRAVVVTSHWSGHGEGGNISRVVIVGGYSGNPYESTPEDIQRLNEEAAYINSKLSLKEDKIKDAAYDEGYDDGYDDGYEDGQELEDCCII